MYISLLYKDTVKVAYLVYTIYLVETVFQYVNVDMNLCISDSLYLICMTFRDELDLKEQCSAKNAKKNTQSNVIPFNTVSLNQTSFIYHCLLDFLFLKLLSIATMSPIL